jgi:hypothetical protein
MIEKKLKEKQKERPRCNLCPQYKNNLRELILDTAEERKFLSVWLLQELPEQTDAFAQQWWCGFGFDFLPLHTYHCRNGAP